LTTDSSQLHDYLQFSIVVSFELRFFQPGKANIKLPNMSLEEEPKVKTKTEEPEENDQKVTKRQKTDANAGESDGDGGTGGGDDDDENDSFKIKSRREANRLHALKSRQRSKQLLSDLQTTVGQLKSDKQDLERQNSVLLAQVDVLQQQNYKLLQGQQMLLAQNPSMAAPSSMAQNQITPSSMGSGGLSSGAYAGLQQQQPGMGGFMQQHLMGGSESSVQGMFPGQQQLQMAQLQHFQQQQLQQQQLQQQNAMMMNGQQSQNPGQSLMGMNGQQALLDRQPGNAAKES
jgi:hypothetical protein